MLVHIRGKGFPVRCFHAAVQLHGAFTKGCALHPCGNIHMADLIALAACARYAMVLGDVHIIDANLVISQQVHRAKDAGIREPGPQSQPNMQCALRIS